LIRLLLKGVAVVCSEVQWHWQHTRLPAHSQSLIAT